MDKPILSTHFKSREPSDVRLAQIRFGKRPIKPEKVINVAIGNVSLPMNPAMQRRMFELDSPKSPFRNGAIRYAATEGDTEAQDAFRNILKSEGFDADDLYIQITEGGSAGMELLLLGVCGEAGTDERPLMMIDPTYTNYTSFAKRVGRKTITITRHMGEDGKFNLPDMEEIEEVIKANNPGALLVIPYDNPTGQFYTEDIMKELASLCVKYNMWLASDEAYRGLYYDRDEKLVSIWGLSDADVPGIEGRRISIETTSKMWNACGLRIGAVITDNREFNNRSVAEYTANLCANSIGQYIFGALAHESKESILEWCREQRDYYREQIVGVYKEFKKQDPRLIVSSPDASIYSVIDVGNAVRPGFDSTEFVLYCAELGAVEIDGIEMTLLVAPMKGFYNVEDEEQNPGRTQMRISFVESPENMALVPELFVKLLRKYEEQR
ncbi:MAG: aminotransferase class I/II-fold pyridoxal phosphate-dependent enzyme [Tissierellia bacterium]|nr:aminotransferase class I/II-fold pyridoxal phosphate-dependent enzyme [Tissierellia bacterium]